MIRFAILCLILLTSCTHHYRSRNPEYSEHYSYTSHVFTSNSSESDYYLILYTNARRLDYWDNRSFFKTLARHPSDGSRNRDVGHAWIELHGKIDGEPFVLEGGHSGELGTHQPRYFDGVVAWSKAGYENPVRYLWAVQNDGFFQSGNGGHKPTFAAKVHLTKEQFQEILQFIGNYDFSHYAIARNQCSVFVAEVAAIAGLQLEHRLTIEIMPEIKLGFKRYHLWSDPTYSKFTFSSPDVLERSLAEAVLEGRVDFFNTKEQRSRRSQRKNN